MSAVSPPVEPLIAPGPSPALTFGRGADSSVKDGSWTEPVLLTSGSTFKLSFTVTDGSSPVVPQQAYIVFRDTQYDEVPDVTLALGVKPNGKATYYIVRAHTSFLQLR